MQELNHRHPHTHTHTHSCACMCVQDAQEKIRELEGCIHEERTRVQKEKRDQTEQIRSLKAEIKSLTDKIERSALELLSGWSNTLII